MTSMNLMQKVSRKIRAIRKVHQLSQTQVARIMGTSQATVSKIENAQTEPGLLEWLRFCREFGVNPTLEEKK